MDRIFRLSTLVVLGGLTLGAVAPARADFATGTQGVADFGSPTINTSSLSTATTFTFGQMMTTAAETGSFANPTSSGMIISGSSPAVLNMANQTLVFGDSDFGMFTASSVVPLDSTNQVRSFMILGMFTSGARFGAATTSPASFNLSFTSNSTSTGTSYADSGTLSVPAAPAGVAVPEPASVVMLGLGLLGTLGYVGRRRLAK